MRLSEPAPNGQLEDAAWSERQRRSSDQTESGKPAHAERVGSGARASLQGGEEAQDEESRIKCGEILVRRVSIMAQSPRWKAARRVQARVRRHPHAKSETWIDLDDVDAS
jgi:hypothetical protein